MPIHEVLKQYRVTFIKENYSEIDDLGDEQNYIEGVDVEEVDWSTSVDSILSLNDNPLVLNNNKFQVFFDNLWAYWPQTVKQNS